jgi:hypothetical protein
LPPPRYNKTKSRRSHETTLRSGRNPSGKCFELCRGVDLSFGYNKNSRPESFMTPEEVRALIGRLAANNGRLLLAAAERGAGHARVLRGLY